MGRTQTTTINHFSHPHPLHLTNFDHNQLHSLTPSTTHAACCTNPTSGMVYTCKPCDYVIHVSCSQLPKLINHPFDKLHSLPLLAGPAYDEGVFNCDACGSNGTGFCYHCSHCGLDLHGSCASMPLSVNSQAHMHTLSLLFSPPYENQSFSCDLCGGVGGNHWLYNCATCEFDTHITCVHDASQQQRLVQSRGVVMGQRVNMMSNSGRMQGGVVYRPQQPMNNQENGGVYVPQQPMMNNQGNGAANNGTVVSQAVEGLVSGVVNGIFGLGSGNGGGGSSSTVVVDFVGGGGDASNYGGSGSSTEQY